MPLIFVTNDDGIASPGIKALAKALRPLGDVYVVAPETEQSAAAHSLTLHRPLKTEQVGKNMYHVNGTPTDCVIVAVSKLLPRRPDIIVSGINIGANLGDDVTYSGTVAAAIEGTLVGIPSIAVSLVTNKISEKGEFLKAPDFRAAASIAGMLAKKILLKGLPKDTLLNVNVPNIAKIKGRLFTRQGKHVYDNAIRELNDPRGRKCYWIGGGIPKWEQGGATDLDAINRGYISVTPIHLDLTNYDALRFLKRSWKLQDASKKNEGNSK